MLIDYVEKDRPSTEAYYTSLLEKLEGGNQAIRRHLAKMKVPFHYDDAPPHTSKVFAAKRFEVLPHTPHSPDLGPTDYFFP